MQEKTKMKIGLCFDKFVNSMVKHEPEVFFIAYILSIITTIIILR